FGSALKINASKESSPVIEVKQLSVAFPQKKSLLGGVSEWMSAVQALSFELNPGTSLGIVGESGSGKTTIALALARLLTNQAKVKGDVIIDKVNINSLRNN